MYKSSIPDNAPVIIGVGDLIDKSMEDGLNPLSLLQKVSEIAIKDCDSKSNLRDHFDYVGVTRFSVDFSTATNQLNFDYSNFPKSLANALNIKKDVNEVYSSMGGNAPQVLIEDLVKKISNQEINCALISGGEVLQTMIARLKSGLELNWSDHPGGLPELIGNNEEGFSKHEQLHGMDLPSNVYPLFAQSIRENKKQNATEHLIECSEIFSKFSKVASENKNAWFPTFRTPEEIATITDSNRLVGFPYTKYLNSMIRVNMGASVVITSEKKANELNISQEKRIYLHGASVLNDIWHVSERPKFNESPAIRNCVDQSLKQADINIEDIDYFDIYSCFPSAVQVAIQEMGLSIDEKRDLTVTGGLPYFGGPGNSYTMFSTAEMVRKLRTNRTKYGMVTANSWFLTKHAVNIFSSNPPVNNSWELNNINIQKEIDSKAIKNLNHTPMGTGIIETYTIINGRDKLKFGIVIGRLNDGSRFIANTPKDEGLLQKMIDHEMIGKSGEVYEYEGKNIFKLGLL